MLDLAKNNQSQRLSFTGYYHALLGKSLRQYPAKPNFVCNMGDKGFLKCLPKLLKCNDLKNDILIIHKKSKSDESLVFELSQKAYNRLYGIFFKDPNITMSDGKLEVLSDYLKFLKPNSKIKKFVFELPKHHIDSLHILQSDANKGFNMSIMGRIYGLFYNNQFKNTINSAIKAIKVFKQDKSRVIDDFFKKIPNKEASKVRYYQDLSKS